MSSKKILVVEDNAKNLKLVKDLLEQGGHHVISARDGTSGVESAAEQIPDLILMDIQLPGLDGLMATRQLKSDASTSDIPVIAVTAHARSGDSERIRDAGCDGYITKPIDTRQFLKLVEQALSTRASSSTDATTSNIESGKTLQGTGAGTILVVDDEDRNRRLAEATLLPGGYNIRHATNGEEALEEIRRERPDLVLLDIMMPGIDGIEVTRRLRASAETRALPIILITAFADDENRLRGIEAGCDDFLAKPFDRNVLLARIRSLIRLSKYRQRLKERERLDVVLREMGEGVVIMDHNWNVERINEPAYRLLGFDGDVTDSGSLLNQIADNRRLSIERWILEDSTTDNIRFEIEREETVDSAGLVLSAFLKRFRNEDGKVGGLILTLKDITSGRTEERMKDDFLSSVSHKLRTPLSVILANSDAMLSGFTDPLSEDQTVAVRDIYHSCVRLNDLVDKLFAFISPESDDEDDRVARPAGEFLKSYVEQAGEKFPPESAKISLQLGEGSNQVIQSQWLSVVIDNLIENSVKFSADGLANIEIHAGGDNSGCVRIDVRDDGPGIPEEDVQNVFDRFYQVEKVQTGSIEGFGLGLPLARRLIERVGGTIELKSRLGEGACFSIKLPVPRET